MRGRDRENVPHAHNHHDAAEDAFCTKHFGGKIKPTKSTSGNKLAQMRTWPITVKIIKNKF